MGICIETEILKLTERDTETGRHMDRRRYRDKWMNGEIGQTEITDSNTLTDTHAERERERGGGEVECIAENKKCGET